MSLRPQAIRMMRGSWKSPRQLAEELYLILLQDEDIDPGPVTYTINNITVTEPSTTVRIFPPDLFTPPDLRPPPSVVETPEGDRVTRITTYTEYQRLCCPGQVIAQTAGPWYWVDLYIFGSQAPEEFFDLGTGELTGTDYGVPRAQKETLQLQIDVSAVIPTGTWVNPVFWFKEFEIVTTEVLTLPERALISRTTSINLVRESCEMQVPVWL